MLTILLMSNGTFWILIFIIIAFLIIPTGSSDCDSETAKKRHDKFHKLLEQILSSGNLPEYLSAFKAWEDYRAEYNHLKSSSRFINELKAKLDMKAELLFKNAI